MNFEKHVAELSALLRNAPMVPETIGDYLPDPNLDPMAWDFVVKERLDRVGLGLVRRDGTLGIERKPTEPNGKKLADLESFVDLLLTRFVDYRSVVERLRPNDAVSRSVVRDHLSRMAERVLDQAP